MIIKIGLEKAGKHYLVAMYMGEHEDSLNKIGVMLFDEKEWRLFLKVIQHGKLSAELGTDFQLIIVDEQHE